VQFFSVLLPLSFITALFTRYIRKFSSIFLTLFLGFLFAYFAFFIANIYLKVEAIHFFANIILIIALLLVLVFYAFKNEILKFAILFILSFCFFIKYSHASVDFPIFANELLDNETIFSLAFILFALLLSFCFFFFTRWQSKFNEKLSFIFLIIFVLCESDEALASVVLTAIREGFLDAHSLLLSFVAKSLYYAFSIIYLYLFLIFILGLNCLLKRAKHIHKTHLFDNDFRQKVALNLQIRNFFILAIASIFLSISVLSYFTLVASKPIEIDTPTEITPDENNEFVFDVAILRDNNLHRFAYVTSEGKVVRFFLINKREDKDSPVAVFDSCMLCGDMGYVKRGGELICISCNVRIFLPSVGKEGGCNPIPLKYTFDGQKVIIKLADVIKGSGYFTQVKEIEVKDPVDGSKLINLQAPYSYTYAGLTYYFSSEKNYDLFRQDPSKFVDSNASAKFRIQGY